MPAVQPVRAALSLFTARDARRRLRRAAIALAVVLPLTACDRSASLTAPELDAPAPAKRNAVCVQVDASGAIIAVEPPDGNGQCSIAFDLIIWT